MEANLDMGTDIVEQLIALQEMDRGCDRLQRRLDEVPRKLRKHTDAIAAFESALAAQDAVALTGKAEADRAELEVQSKEEIREKIKLQMNAPKLSNREYEVLQEQLAGVLADINSLSDQAIKSLQRAQESEEQSVQIRADLEKARAAHEAAREKLEGSLTGVREDLDARLAKRNEFAEGMPGEQVSAYERVRRKHKDALSVVEGTIDRAAGRIGNDLHCSACYMTITSNDAVRVLARKVLIQCKSCVRILYVP